MKGEDLTVAYVITTIQAPSAGVRSIAERVRGTEHALVVIGDRKTPSDWECPGATYLSFDEQSALSFASAQVLPANSYTRKMLGYLHAASHGATWIRETDDDNAPYESFFSPVPDGVVARVPSESSGWVNIYRYFTERFVWPRGLPLSSVRLEPTQSGPQETREVTGPIVWQALADGDPDVDAVYRLTTSDPSDVTFDPREPLAIASGTWTPFNSQATTWPIELLPLMYLPATCSFRMTDIWRSFVAQRLMPGLGAHLVVTAPTVFQDRNAHDLMRDFRDEIEGYVGYDRFISTLESTSIDGTAESILVDLRLVYEALIEASFLQPDELTVLDAWIDDMRTLGHGQAASR